MSMYLFKLITFFDGLALFLFGMDVMGKALEQVLVREIKSRHIRRLRACR